MYKSNEQQDFALVFSQVLQQREDNHPTKPDESQVLGMKDADRLINNG